MFGLKLVKEADYYNVLQKKQEVENLNHNLNVGIEANRNAVENLKKTNVGLKNQLIEAKNKNEQLRCVNDISTTTNGELGKRYESLQNDLAELSKKYSKINEQKVNLEKEVKTKEVIIENYTDKMSTDRACIIELENKLAKLQKKYDFEHVENKMKIKGFDRGQYYQVLGFTDKANAFVRLSHSNLKSLKGKIFNFEQLKKEIFSSGLEVSYFDIVRVDVKL